MTHDISSKRPRVPETVDGRLLGQAEEDKSWPVMPDWLAQEITWKALVNILRQRLEYLKITTVHCNDNLESNSITAVTLAVSHTRWSHYLIVFNLQAWESSPTCQKVQVFGPAKGRSREKSFSSLYHLSHDWHWSRLISCLFAPRAIVDDESDAAGNFTAWRRRAFSGCPCQLAMHIYPVLARRHSIVALFQTVSLRDLPAL